MSSELSLWLMPVGDVYLQLENIINGLGAEFASPLFAPHITLLGRMNGSVEEMTAKTAQLATRLEPFELELDRVEYLPEYYRSLFVRARESEPLMAANRLARELFGRQNDPPFMPHMSLLYGDFTPQVKERIIQKIKGQALTHFTVTDLYLYSTLGDTREWYEIRKFALEHIGAPQT